MLFVGVLSLLVAAVSAESCYDEMTTACEPNDITEPTIENCTSPYGGFTQPHVKLQGFAIANLEESFHLLLISSYFGNYDINREGFKKLYRQYSDKLWEDAIDVMKYIAKRGGSMNFKQVSDLSNNEINNISFEEIKSLAWVLDTQKELAKLAFNIHSHSAETIHYDPAIAHYIEERFLEKYTERIQDLSGYISELKGLSKSNTITPVSLFLFDEYLKKTL